MTAMYAPRVALDETAITFISTFMAHVATLTDRHKTRIVTTARIEALLLATFECGDGDSSSEWRALYRAITDLVDRSIYAYEGRAAYAYFRQFIRENHDLAD